MPKLVVEDLRTTEMHEFRSYTFLGVTKSLCPDCEELVDAKIVSRGSRVYFRKTCPEHGVREDFVCSDRSQFDRNDYSFPGKLPTQFGAEVKKGCPYDCGLCEEHEQHTCCLLYTSPSPRDRG